MQYVFILAAFSCALAAYDIRKDDSKVSVKAIFFNIIDAFFCL